MMKKSALIAVLIIVSGVVSAQTFKYVGASKCKMCHNSADKGAQYTKWTETKHSKALAALSTPQALQIAKAKNIADPSKDTKCLKCHSTAASIGADLNAGITVEEGVSCESCHGPGSSYKAIPVMKDLAAATKNGLIIPSEATCKKCHNPESPTFKSFDYKTYAAKIAHPNPAKK